MNVRLGALLAAVRGQVSGARALDTVRAIASHHRIQSTPGYEAAAAWLVAALAEHGIEAEVERVTGDGRTRRLGALLPEGWACSRAVATLHGTRGAEPLCDFAAEPLSVIQRSAPARGRFRVVDGGDGSALSDFAGADLQGAAVLASGPVHRVHELAVVERGAAGIVSDFRRLLPPVRNPGDDLDAVAYTSFWWSERARRGWGVVVSPRRAAELRERMRAGEPLEIEVEIETRAYAAEVPLVSAVLRARDPAASEVLVLSHLCHPRPGANDNASGAAATLECVRVLAELRARGAWPPGERTVRFLWMPEWNGTLAWLAADPARARRTVAAINLDMVGEDQAQCGSTLLLEHPPHFCATFAEPLLARIRRDWIAAEPERYGGMRVGEAPFSGGSDHAILLDPAIAVPCPMLIQWPDRYYHSSLDTADRCDPDSLAIAAGVAATYAAWLASAGADDLRDLEALLAEDARERGDIARSGADAARATGREAERARRSLASLERLAPRGRSRATAPETAAAPASRPLEAGDVRVPLRLLAAPLDLLFHLLPGWDDSAAADREWWLKAERETPGGRLSLDLAWYACDGHRDLTAIAAAIERESGARVSAGADAAGFSLAAFFDATARLGLSRWKSASHAAPAG